MQITVKRAPADKQGPDIVDDLLNDEITAVAKGTWAIDYNCSSRTVKELTGPLRDVVRTCLIAMLTEAHGESWGMTRYWNRHLTLEDDVYTRDTTVRIEMERDPNG